MTCSKLNLSMGTVKMEKQASVCGELVVQCGGLSAVTLKLYVCLGEL